MKKIQVLYGAMPCPLANKYRIFGGASCPRRTCLRSPKRLRRGQKSALQPRYFIPPPPTDPCFSKNYRHCHYSVGQSSPLVCAPNQTMQTQTLSFLFSIICFNAVLLSTPKFTEFPLSFLFSNLIFYSFSFLPYRASTASCSLILSP